MIFIIVIGFSAGALIESLLSLAWPTAAFFTLISALAYGAWHITRERHALIAFAALAACSAGMARAELAPHALPPAFAPLIQTDSAIEGIIAADIDTRETSQRVTVEIEKNGEHTRMLAVAPSYPAFSYGERVRVRGTPELPAPFDGEGDRTFRYDRYLAKDGIFAIIQRARVDVTAPRSGLFTRVHGALYDAKDTFIRALSRALPEPEAGLAAGILTGGKQGLGKTLLAAFTAAGLVQIVVLSGYNVAIIASGVVRALAFLPRRAALGIAALCIVLFVIAAGSGSSAVRAGMMACLALYARGSGRSYDALRALAAAVLIMLLWNPLLLAFDPGFDLSLAATLGLILLTPAVMLRLAFIRNAALLDAAATTGAAQAAVLPLLLYQTGNLSLVSFPANVIVSFAVPMAMLLSAIAGVVALAVPAIAPVAGIPAYVLLLFIVKIAEWSAALPLATFSIPAFPFIFAVVAYTLLACIAYRHRKAPAAYAAGAFPGTLLMRKQGSALPPSSN
ncbi:MAG TPA: ComEC/Rec2 family competence protein [Candidatus Paceibacterota bacterium]